MSESIRVEVQQLPHGEGLALPAYQSALAAGLDLLAAIADDRPLVLEPQSYVLVPTGLAIALPAGFEAQVRPRSGLAAKHGITVLNAPRHGGCRLSRRDFRAAYQSWRQRLHHTARRAHRAVGDRPCRAGGTRHSHHIDTDRARSGGFGSTGRNFAATVRKSEQYES